jgi:hypothetical protein
MSKDLNLLLELLADLTLDAEDFEIAKSALRLQVLLKEFYNV